MNEFRFDHLKNRKRQRLPRPILYVGVAIILLAFFSIKWFQRAGDTGSAPSGAIPAEAPARVPELEKTAAPAAPPAPVPLTPPDADDSAGGILALDGEGARLQPPRRISGPRPAIPAALLAGETLSSPSVYVRVGKDGLVADCKLVSSSGSGEVDRLVLDALRKYVFHPATTAGQPVEYSSVVSVPLHAAAGDSAPGGSGTGRSF